MTKEELKSLDVYQRNKNKLLKLLSNNKSDLNFGLYKMFKYQRETIGKFFDDATDNGFLDIVHNAINSHIDEQDKIKQIEQIFDDIYNFFSKFYNNGNFITQSYISEFNNAGAKLIWATQNQYFVKNDVILEDYSFKLKNHTFIFKVVDAEIVVNNVKDSNKKYFLLKEIIKHENYNQNDKQVVYEICFDYRALRDDELRQFIKDDDNNPKTLKQTTINKQIMKEILAKVDDEAKALLAGKLKL